MQEQGRGVHDVDVRHQVTGPHCRTRRHTNEGDRGHGRIGQRTQSENAREAQVWGKKKEKKKSVKVRQCTRRYVLTEACRCHLARNWREGRPLLPRCRGLDTSDDPDDDDRARRRALRRTEKKNRTQKGKTQSGNSTGPWSPSPEGLAGEMT